MGQEKMQGLYWLVNGGGWWSESVGQMVQEKLQGLYCLVKGGGLWIERQRKRWDKRNCNV
jgi:hypothetical protein